MWGLHEIVAACREMGLSLLWGKHASDVRQCAVRTPSGTFDVKYSYRRVCDCLFAKGQGLLVANVKDDWPHNLITARCVCGGRGESAIFDITPCPLTHRMMLRRLEDASYPDGWEVEPEWSDPT